jgi:5-methylcytosine-specific restriction endonuclease McrA
MTETFEMPRIIRLRKYVKVAKNLAMVRYSRRNIILRDKGTCQYCSKKVHGKDATLDHVMPKSRGGKSTWTNIVLSCRSCNGKKDNRTPAEAGMILLKEPVKPQAKTDLLDRLLKEFGFSFDSLE